MADHPALLPQRLAQFVSEVEWVFARTYATTWPHHYIVKDRVDRELFLTLVRHIREQGYEGRFYNHRIVYFDHDGMVYWTMVPPAGSADWYPVEEETIVNRCGHDQTYAARLTTGTLPENDRGNK